MVHKCEKPCHVLPGKRGTVLKISSVCQRTQCYLRNEREKEKTLKPRDPVPTAPTLP